ncbi:hypothetical protein DOTSEDRAFT_72905 [Dothistroma septosporum NZE10]|uniref:Uncharacterized protein n=1 Tax=Dothistroma septosporum (strain NZE10 / CBS 128990) TaxID=675120 RepID=M2XMN1_DOTSN|nr:hypothetical protein DOTSEDRAFT_72905 [Dothistroma septosporum NZE10]
MLLLSHEQQNTASSQPRTTDCACLAKLDHRFKMFAECRRSSSEHTQLRHRHAHATPRAPQTGARHDIGACAAALLPTTRCARQSLAYISEGTSGSRLMRSSLNESGASPKS